MNILDFASNTEEEEVLKSNPQSYQVIGEVVNSAVQGDGPAMNYQPNMNQGTVLQDVIGAEQSQLANEEQQIAQQEQVVQNQEQAVQQEAQGETSFLKGLADGLASVFTNPDVLTGLNSFGAAMAGDINSYNAYQNAYAERMENRAQQRAAAAQKQRDNEAANARAMQEQLWKQYTPESVAEFQRTGDYGVLMENEATKMAREAHNTDVAYKGWQMTNTEKQQNLEQGNKDRDYNLESEKFGYSQEKDVNESLNKGAQQKTENAQKDRSLDIQEKQADATINANQKKADSESKEKWKEAEMAVQTGVQTVKSIDDLLADESLSGNFGSVEGRLPIWGENAKRVDSRLSNLSSKLFVNGVQDLRGLGALSNAEGARITAAASRLFNSDGSINYGLSDSDAREAIKEIRDTLEARNNRLLAERDSYNTPSYAKDSRYTGGNQNTSSASQGSNTTGSKYQDGQRISYKGETYVIRNGKPVKE